MRHRVFRPPYCYRWAVLITALATMITLAVSAFRSDAAGSATTLTDSSTAPSTAATPEQPSVPADLVRHAARPGRVVALTFDDGPHPEYTPRVLALLAEHGAVATFCIVGAEAARHPELVRAVAAAGMALCAHTITHDEDLSARPAAQIEAEVVSGRQAIIAAAGAATVPYFRAPAGNWSDRVRDTAARNGMRPLSWSMDSRDWTRPGAAQIVSAVQHGVRPGAVILLHDGGGRRDQTVDALAQLLPWLVEQGYGFDLPG